MHVALLRSLNVGRTNRIRMPDLAACFEGAGARAVRTYIQSGNVWFEADDAAGVAERALAALVACEVHTTIVLRDVAALVAVLAASPFDGADEDHLHVGFLAGPATGALDPRRVPADVGRLVGRELHLRLVDGVAKAPFTTPGLDKALGTVVTVRNWRTVRALAAG